MVADPYIGRTVGDFIIRERIGQGGTATVYRAYQPSVSRDVALKIIPLGVEAENYTNFQQRFTQEAELIAGLEHIHILPVYDYGVTAREAYLAMRLLPGGSLRDLLVNGEPLELNRAVDLFGQISKGLAYAHSKGVIHRDIKPGNIMLDDAGNALLTDFGLAKIIGDSAEITRTGTIIGTPLYMAPEQLRGEPLDARADIYSLGVIFYQMLTGRTPFGSEYGDLVTTIYQQLEREPIPPRQFNSAIPREVEGVILRALAKKPEGRYPTATDMRDDLLFVLGRSPSRVGQFITRPVLRQAKPGLWQRWRQRVLWGMAGLVLAVVAGLMGVVVAELNDSDGPSGELHGPLFVPTVRTGESAPSSAIVPSTLELERARAALADGGFIGYITCTLQTEYHATQAREIRDLATLYALDLRLYDSNTDEYREITQIEKARADGATGLIVCPVNSTVLANTLTAVQQANLPLVLLDSNIPSYGGVRLSGDDYRMGLMVGRHAGERIRAQQDGQARVLLLEFPDMLSIVTRAQGLVDGLHQVAPDAVIVGRVRGGTREFAQASVAAVLAEGTRFDVVLSINDAGSLGAIAALEDAGIAPHEVSIYSIDAEATMLSYIANSYYARGSLAINRAEFSRVALDAMVILLAGGTLPETVIIPPGTMVTRDTLTAAPGGVVP